MSVIVPLVNPVHLVRTTYYFFRDTVLGLLTI
jgi:hypothetical protein